MSTVNRVLIVLLALMLLVGCQQRVLAPTPNLYVHAETDPYADVPPEFQTSAVDMLYATDRAREGEKDGSVEYGYDRSPVMAWGSCKVEIGKDVSWEELVAASRTEKRKVKLPLKLGTVAELGRFPETPPPLEIEGNEVRETDEYMAEHQAALAAFHDELRRRLALTPRKEVFLFVHGYHNTLADGAFRMAEIWHLIGREGVPILYSWPAGHPGLLQGYTADRESSEFTVYHLKLFLVALAACPEIERLNVIAHSRGTDVLVTAARELVLHAEGGGRDPQEVFKIGNFVLAAPDIDLEVVQQRSGSDRLFRIYERGTVYVSQKDRALGAAEWLFANPNRMGRLRPEQMDERTRQRMMTFRTTEVVDARVRTDRTGHGYFLSNPAASSDLVLVLRYDRPPGAENGRPLTEVAPNWFIINDDYPMKAAPLPRELQED
jgi:esterase/lipase superfamily enzyme